MRDVEGAEGPDGDAGDVDGGIVAGDEVDVVVEGLRELVFGGGDEVGEGGEAVDVFEEEVEFGCEGSDVGVVDGDGVGGEDQGVVCDELGVGDVLQCGVDGGGGV